MATKNKPVQNGNGGWNIPANYKSEYPGKLVFNANVGRFMRLLAPYRTFFKRREGVYSDAFDDFVNILAKRVKSDQQNVIIIEGETGSGKSSLALNLCVALARKLKVGFDLEKDYIYSDSDLWRKLEDEDANPINLLDEGSVTLASNNAMRKSDKSIATLFDTMRSKHWTTIIVCPNMSRINATVRRNHCEFKLRCTPVDKPLIPGYGRGFFEVRQASRNEFDNNKENTWLMLYAGVFGDYPPMLRAEYLEIKARRQEELMRQYINRAKLDTAKEVKQFEKYCPKEDINGEW